MISSGPSLVSRDTQVSSWMWMVVKRSSWTTRSDRQMESSKLKPFHGMNATRMFWPRASSPMSVDGPSAMMSPRPTTSPFCTSGRWLMQVFWLERVYLVRL
ncbi:hypothetical protein D3C78_856630 [compost metagenome]